jgi:hypothetical protein
MQFYWFIIGVLAVWRLSFLLVAEAGPWDLFKGMRRRLAGSVFGDLANCFYCLSLWVSVPFGFLLNGTWKGRLLLWLALSAGAIIIETAVHRGTFMSTPLYHEDQEEPHVLRQAHARESVHHS